MGAGVSMIQKVGSPTQLLTDQLFASMEKDIKNFDQFHIAFLEVLNKFNAAMPGVHYDVPARAEVKECYRKWNEEKDDEEKRKDLLTKLLEKSNIISKTDTALLLTGVAAPPVAMIGKRAAGNFPTLSFVKLVPDVLFVPSVTLLAVGCMKYARKNKLPEAAVPAKEQSSSADAQ
ncbi:calcium ion-binding protein [Cinnamomum micranthum f. kanehirae]|uniref:Calcium ion-binding protein n=1 Tax=Cinnamomum micranthum f. kanehirae TaxID=337451 RepID=A0A3S3NUC6_9MAGN|nr:calcium ion-binding protein [Cinnamomum micranthum f. kanehirae]